MANLAILMAKIYSLKYHFLLGNQRFLEKKDEIRQDEPRISWQQKSDQTTRVTSKESTWDHLDDQRWDNLNFNGRIFA